MAATWHGGLQGYNQYINNSTLFTAIGNAMDYWFNNNFTNIGCLVEGGTDSCVHAAHLVAGTQIGHLHPRSRCRVMSSPQRRPDTYTIGQLYPYLPTCVWRIRLRMQEQISWTWPKPVCIKVLYFFTLGRVQESPRYHCHTGKYQQISRWDPVERFLHLGLLYNGNYGKHFSNGVLGFEMVAVGTLFAAGSGVKGGPRDIGQRKPMDNKF